MITLRPSTATCAVACAVVTLPAMGTVAAASASQGRIAYGSEFSETWRSRHLDGTSNRPLLYHARDVSFSADGRRLAYVRVKDEVDTGIAVARGNGRDPTWVIRPFDQRIPFMTNAFEVALSPDGTHVAAEIQTQPDMDAPGGGWMVSVYVVGSDGSDLRLLAANAAFPTWSPDRDQIAYLAANDAVETIAPDGTGKRMLLAPEDRFRRKTNRQFKADIELSPDGRSLMFRQISRRPRMARLAIADLLTGTVRRLPARITGFVYDAVWCANGQRIAFTAPPTPTSPVTYETRRIYTIRPDGTGKRLAFNVGTRWPSIDGLAWQPPLRPLD